MKGETRILLRAYRCDPAPNDRWDVRKLDACIPVTGCCSFKTTVVSEDAEVLSTLLETTNAPICALEPGRFLAYRIRMSDGLKWLDVIVVVVANDDPCPPSVCPDIRGWEWGTVVSVGLAPNQAQHVSKLSFA
jgi:hypothetical protein